jgi:hypothetical protein
MRISRNNYEVTYKVGCPKQEVPENANSNTIAINECVDELHESPKLGKILKRKIILNEDRFAPYKPVFLGIKITFLVSLF